MNRPLPARAYRQAAHLLKEAAKWDAYHGTYKRFEKLVGGLGRPKHRVPETIFGRGMEAATVAEAADLHAHQAVKAFGGEPVRAKVMVDTSKGWRAKSPMPRAYDEHGDDWRERFDELVEEIDESRATKGRAGAAERGPRYRELKKLVGIMWHPPRQEVPVREWKRARPS